MDKTHEVLFADGFPNIKSMYALLGNKTESAESNIMSVVKTGLLH